MNTYTMVFQPYDETPAPRVVRFKAPNDKLAFLKASPDMSWGCGKFDPEDIENCLPDDYLEMSVEEMAEDLYSSNGDGGDFLYLLKNENTGEVIFQDGEYEDNDKVEEWDVKIPAKYLKILL